MKRRNFYGAIYRGAEMVVMSERKGFRGPRHLVSEADWKPGTAWHCQNASEPEPPK